MRSPSDGSNGMARVIILALLPGAMIGSACWGSITGSNESVNSKQSPDYGLSGMMRRCYYG